MCAGLSRIRHPLAALQGAAFAGLMVATLARLYLWVLAAFYHMKVMLHSELLGVQGLTLAFSIDGQLLLQYNDGGLCLNQVNRYKVVIQMICDKHAKVTSQSTAALSTTDNGAKGKG